MQTYYFVSAKKRDNAPVYVRLSHGRGVDLIVKTDLFVNPSRWSNDTQTIKQRIRSDQDEQLITKLSELKKHIESEFKNHSGGLSKEWLFDVVFKYHNKRSADAKNLNEFISQFIAEAEAGNKDFTSGYTRVLKGFQGVFNMYQGIYSEKQLKKIDKENERRKENNKPLKELRPLNKLNFEDITDSFYESFLRYLFDEGYKINTVGRFIKNLKYVMKKSIKIHKSRDFQEFEGKTADSFSIALTEDELNKIYNLDLSKIKRDELVRDSFIAMAETGVRVSDRKNIKIVEINGIKCIEFTQKKTGKKVIAPTSPRFLAIWNKYDMKLPTIHENNINKLIKNIAFRCGIVETEKVPDNKYGKEFERSEKRHNLVSCHTARRSAATNWYRNGIPIEDISILLGHATVKQTRIYLKISEEENALRIAKLPYFIKLQSV